jgi:hypothetical protein
LLILISSAEVSEASLEWDWKVWEESQKVSFFWNSLKGAQKFGDPGPTVKGVF